MKLVLSTAVLATVLAPAFSFSYLESLSPNPVSYSGGKSPSNGASYLDALNSPVSKAPSGGGMRSYLDSVATNPSVSGPGIGSFADKVGGAAPAPAAPAPAPAAPVAASSSAPAATSAGNYLSTLSSGSTAISGRGVTGYLDTVPRNAPVSGGAGIASYTAALPITNVVYGTGAGFNTYTDNLSGGSSSKSSGSYSPFGGKGKPAASFKPSFSGSAGGQDIGFTLEASDLSELVKSMSGGGTIRLSGSIDSVSFN